MELNLTKVKLYAVTTDMAMRAQLWQNWVLLWNLNSILAKPSSKKYITKGAKRASQTHVLRFFCFFVFFFSQNIWLFLWTVHGMQCSRIHKFHISATFSLKMGPTVLFTHLKIILLQYFSVFNFNFQFSTVSKRTLNNLLKGLF